MEIVAAIVGALLAGLIGIWINNFFTWGIKNKIDALDQLYLDILAYHRAFFEFVVEITDITKIPENANENMRAKMRPLEDKIYLNCYIADGVRSGFIYKKVYQWSQCLEDILKNSSYVLLQNENNQYHELFQKLQISIQDYRIDIIRKGYILYSILRKIKDIC